MLSILGNIIEKHPVIVILVVLMITIGFSLFIPRIEFKTDFEEFTPDDEIVKASDRVQEYFGESQQLIFIYAEKEDSPHVLTADAIREINYLQNELKKDPNVLDSFSIVTFLEMICFIEFGSSIENCTDAQVEIAVTDLLTNYSSEELTLLVSDDPNEAIDYQRFPRLSKGKSIDAADIKNGIITKKDGELTISFNVYDLQGLSSPIKPVFPHVNVMEWYLDFQNQIIPIEEMNISYTLAVHIEPMEDFWVVGDGFFHNLRHIIQQISNRNLLHAYSKEVFLWIQPQGQSYSLPIKMNTGNVSIHPNQDQIQLTVSLKELGEYGIAPQFGSLSLPAKLSDFQMGSRYYQISFFHLPGGRISANATHLFNSLFRFHQKPLLGRLTDSLIQKLGIESWEDFERYYELMESTEMIPDTLALKDIEASWIQSDLAPDSKVIKEKSFPIVPAFYKDLQLNLKSFLSTDYETDMKPSSTLFFLELAPTMDYDEIIKINTGLEAKIADLDEDFDSVKTRATGAGINSAEIDELTTEANQFIAPSIFIIIVLVLFFNFRRVSYVILPMVSLVISTIWLFGAMSMLGITFNVIAIALVPLILGLGVDYSVHLFHNYRIELMQGKTPANAIKDSVKEIGTAMFLAMLTTVIAFLSFLTASVPPVRDFGILLALGVIFTFITSITLLASLRFLLDKRSTKRIKRRQQGLAVQKVMMIISENVLCHQKTILILMIAITIIFALGASQIETGFSMDQFAPTDTPSFELYDVIYEEFPYSSQSQNYILIEGNVATVEMLEGMKKTHENLKDDQYVATNKDGSLKVSSIYSYIRQLVENNESIINRFDINPNTLIPATDDQVRALFDYLYEPDDSEMISMDELTGDLMESFDPSMMSLDLFNGEIKTVLYKEGNRYTAALIRIYLSSTFSSIEGNVQDELEVLQQEISGDVSSYGSAEATITGMNLINLKITNNLTESQVLSTIISIFLAALVLMIVYRSFNLGIIALIPVGISIIWILGTMNFIGYSLNVLTITVTSITIGIGIDYAIHATERFRFIVDKTGDITKAVCETISHTGGALLIAALTTALGFIILVFAPIPPQQQFGLILSVTILYSFLTSIFLLPLVLYHWAKRRKQKYGYVVNKNNASSTQK